MLLGCTNYPEHSDMFNEIDMEVFSGQALFYHHSRPLFRAVLLYGFMWSVVDIKYTSFCARRFDDMVE